MNGTARKHGKKVGYVVHLHGIGIGTDCHGYEDAADHELLCGNFATLFDTLSQAKRAVRDSQRIHPETRYSIIRVARREV
jgi:hypothetical protein